MATIWLCDGRRGKDVVEDERRGADGGVSVGEMHLRVAVEVLLAERDR